MASGLAEVAVHDGGPGDVEDAVGVVGVGSHAAHDLGAVEMSSDVGSGQVESRVEKREGGGGEETQKWPPRRRAGAERT